MAGTAQAFEAKVLDPAGQPVSGVALQFAVTGSNTGATNTNGLVTFCYTGANTGLDVARVSATSFTGVPPATVNVAWVRPNANVALSAITARFFNADTGDTFKVPSSQQPAFTELLTSLSLNPASQPYTGGPAINGFRSPANVVLGDAFDTYTLEDAWVVVEARAYTQLTFRHYRPSQNREFSPSMRDRTVSAYDVQGCPEDQPRFPNFRRLSF